jgi:hypothetical protein
VPSMCRCTSSKSHSLSEIHHVHCIPLIPRLPHCCPATVTSNLRCFHLAHIMYITLAWACSWHTLCMLSQSCTWYLGLVHITSALCWSPWCCTWHFGLMCVGLALCCIHHTLCILSWSCTSHLSIVHGTSVSCALAQSCVMYITHGACCLGLVASNLGVAWSTSALPALLQSHVAYIAYGILVSWMLSQPRSSHHVAQSTSASMRVVTHVTQHLLMDMVSASLQSPCHMEHLSVNAHCHTCCMASSHGCCLSLAPVTMSCRAPRCQCTLPQSCVTHVTHDILASHTLSWPFASHLSLLPVALAFCQLPQCCS